MQLLITYYLFNSKTAMNKVVKENSYISITKYYFFITELKKR